MSSLHYVVNMHCAGGCHTDCLGGRILLTCLLHMIVCLAICHQLRHQLSAGFEGSIPDTESDHELACCSLLAISDVVVSNVSTSLSG